MTEKKHYVGIEAIQPFASVLGEIGRLQEELWNSHIRPERLILSSDCYGKLRQELRERTTKDLGGASLTREAPSTVYGLEIGTLAEVQNEIWLEGVPFRQ